MVLMLAFVFIVVISGSDFELTNVVNPGNVGFMTMLVMIGFGSNKGIITLARLLPSNPRTVAFGLQISIYIIALVNNFTFMLLCVLAKQFFLPDIAVLHAAGHLLLNTAFIVILANIMLPVMLLKDRKFLKIVLICLMLPMYFAASETAGYITGKLTGTGMLPATCLISYVVALITCVLCHAAARKAIKAYDA
ncbi:MAG TPA: hypothetical protein PLG72_10100 [Clostridiales bacterium]|nr:hypothetical protein [Clostridiales bacterium]